MSRGLSSFWDELVAAGDELDRLLELIVRRAAEVVGEASVLATVSADGETLDPAAVFHADPDVRAFVREVLASEPHPIGVGVSGAVAARREPAVLTDIDRDELIAVATPHVAQFLERYPIRSLVVVPMVAFGDVVGTLGAVRMASPVPYDDEDVMVLEALAERAALALAEARRRPRPIGPAEYEAIFQHSVDGILFTAPDGRVLAANPAACHILGRPEDEICRAGRSELLVDDPRSRAAIAQRAIMGGARAELQMRRGNGETFIADVASTIFTTADGELRAAVMFRDVSERVRSRAELATQRDRLALLHRVATAINEATDLTAAIQHTLDAVGEATGWPLGDALLSDGGVLRPSAAWRVADPDRFGWFRTWVEGADPSTGLPVDRRLAGKVLASGVPLWVSDLRATDLSRPEPPGAERLRSYVGVPVMVGSSARGVIELFSDEPRPRDDGLLTLLGDLGTQLGRALERTEADAAHRRLDEERAAFIARAAHELRSPVASLMLAVGVLKGHDLPDPQDQKLLALVAESADHLNRLVNRLLDLSSLEHAVPQLSIEPVDVARIVERALTMHPAPGGRTVANRVPAGTRAMADELSLEEIVINLLGNAYGYGGDQIDVDASREGDRLRLVVADNGVGIEPEMEASIFEPFVRGAGRRSDGAGLGLPISRRLAEAMGGSLRYERREGDGSRFVVDLPAMG